jgi:hypothetical protein
MVIILATGSEYLIREREGKGRKRRKREERGERCIGFQTQCEVVLV